MNVILPILLITSLLQSINSQSNTSSSDKKKKKYDVGTSEHDPKEILDSPLSSSTHIFNKNFEPMDLNNIASYEQQLRQYQSRVVKQLKNEMRKHNRMSSNFTFSPYLSMAAALHKIESKQFANFLANKVLEGFKDANKIQGNDAVDGAVRMRHLRKTFYKVKDYYEKPGGSGSHGTIFPHHNLVFGKSLSDLGVNEYDAKGKMVKEVEPKTSFNLNNIGLLHDYLKQYDESVLQVLNQELKKKKESLKFFEHSPYLSMAAAYYRISSRGFAEFLANNIVRKKIRNADQINDEMCVVKNVRMAHLRAAAEKIKKLQEEEGQAGPSSSGSKEGM